MSELLKSLLNNTDTSPDEVNGTYVKVKFDDESIATLTAWQHEAGLLRPKSSNYLHSTVLYSRQVIDAASIIRDCDICGKVLTITGLNLFGDEKNLVALTATCDELTKLHHQLRDAGGTHDFDTYDIHITMGELSEAIQLEDLPDPTGLTLIIASVQAEPLIIP